MNVKTVKLRKAETALVGMTVPTMEYHNQNNVATIVEQVIEDAGYYVDATGTVDLPDHAVEIKSRAVESTSPHTVGKMSVKRIIKTPYSRSPIKKKFQQQLRVKHNQTFNVVTSAKVYDFSDSEIQQKIEDAYEYGRTIMNSTPIDKLPKYIAPNGHIGYFEKTSKKENSTSYDFRITDSNMKQLEAMADLSKGFRKFFN